MPVISIREHVERIERAARALFTFSKQGRSSTPGEWDRMPDEWREHWREQARVAVQAYGEYAVVDPKRVTAAEIRARMAERGLSPEENKAVEYLSKAQDAADRGSKP